MSKNIFIFLGPPGAGKGSLSKLCIEKLGWVQFSTGNLCRKHISEQTEIGRLIDFTLKSGKLISDELIISMVEEWLEENININKNIIFDGYPRTLSQAESLKNLLKSKLPNCNLKAIRLKISSDILVNRIISRIVCKNNSCQAVYSLAETALAPKNKDICDLCCSPVIKRTDDEEQVIKQRLLAYEKNEEELVKFFSKIPESFFELNVEKQLPDIFNDFKNMITLNYDNN